MPKDENGIEYAIHNGHEYYNWTTGSLYLGMTDSGFRRKFRKIEAENGITIPLIKLPHSEQNVYHDKRILDVFRKSVKKGKEQEWLYELRKVVDVVNSED